MIRRSTVKLRWRVAVMVGAMVGLLAAAATSASASTTSVAAQSASAHSMVAASASTDTHVAKAAGPFRITTPYGTVTYGWRSLANAPADVTPDSASGCNQDVCIQIVGTSNKVNDWDSQAYWDGSYLCTRSRFYANNHLIRTGTVVCGGAGVFYTFWTPNKYFPSPTLACNRWTSIPGYPCETIRK
jgi:hypothetical protein